VGERLKGRGKTAPGRTVAKNTRQRRAEERRAQYENDHTTPTLKMDELRTPLRAAL